MNRQFNRRLFALQIQAYVNFLFLAIDLKFCHLSEFLEVKFIGDPCGNESQHQILGFVRNMFQKQGAVRCETMASGSLTLASTKLRSFTMFYIITHQRHKRSCLKASLPIELRGFIAFANNTPADLLLRVSNRGRFVCPYCAN